MARTIAPRRRILKAALSTAALAASGTLAKPALAAKSKVVYWSPNDINSNTDAGRGEAAMIKVVQAKLPDIEVQVQAMPWQYMGQQTIQAVMSGSGPDVVQLSTSELADQVAAQTTQPLDHYVGKHWTAAEHDDFILPWNTTVYDGAKMAFLWNTVLNNQLYYLKSRFTGAPPTQIDAFTKTLTDIPRSAGEVGFIQSFSQDGNGVVLSIMLIPLLWSAGADFVTDKGEVGFDNPQGVRAFEWLIDMVRRYKLMPQSAVSATRQTLLDAMNARKALSTVMASNGVQSVRNVLGAELGLGMQPGFAGPCPSFAVGKPLIMTRIAKDPVAAGLFIEALVSPEAQLARTKINREIPSRKSVLADDWFKTPAAADIVAATDYMAAYPRLFRFQAGTSRLQIGLALAGQQMVAGRPIREALDRVADEWRTR